MATHLNWCYLNYYSRRKHKPRTLGNLKTECDLKKLDFNKKDQWIDMLVVDDLNRVNRTKTSCVDMFH